MLKEIWIYVVGFNELKSLYLEDPNFGKSWKDYTKPITLDRRKCLDYIIQDEILFRGSHQLCIPRSSMREISSRRSIVDDFLDILVEIRSLLWLLRIITGHSSREMPRILNKVVDCIRWWRELRRIHTCIIYYLYQRSHGRISTWTLFLSCPNFYKVKTHLKIFIFYFFKYLATQHWYNELLLNRHYIEYRMVALYKFNTTSRVCCHVFIH